jgi:hypothetical protein
MVGEQRGRQRLLHVPGYVVGEHAEQHMATPPPRTAMMDWSDVFVVVHRSVLCVSEIVLEGLPKCLDLLLRCHLLDRLFPGASGRGATVAKPPDSAGMSRKLRGWTG